MKIKEIVKQLLPFLAAFLVPIFSSSEILFTFIVLLLIGISFKLSYVKNEEFVVLSGIIIGLIIEVVLGLVYRNQFWENASLIGVPIWLPLIWGYGFLIIRRIGNIIIKA
mgnify:CR=1 FL=1